VLLFIARFIGCYQVLSGLVGITGFYLLFFFIVIVQEGVLDELEPTQSGDPARLRHRFRRAVHHHYRHPRMDPHFFSLFSTIFYRVLLPSKADFPFFLVLM